ncbi:MAG: hypothetical protein OHK0013_05670 [Sandaracinaceae bacterium]
MLALLASLATPLAGCGAFYGTDFVRTGTEDQFPRTDASRIVIVGDEAGRPEGAVVELGLVRAAGYGDRVSEAYVWRRLRAQAAELGATSIIHLRRDQSGLDLVLVGLAVRER